jgi:hypothetical protein
MDDNNQNGLLKSAIGSIGDFFSWIKKSLQDDEVRRATLLDLGLDPDEEHPLPDAPLDNVQQYRKSVDPDEAAYQSAVGDIKGFLLAFKDYFASFSDNPFDLDELVWLFLQVMGTNYLRLRYPSIYYCAQLMGFLREAKATPVQSEASAGTGLALGLISTPAVLLENAWEFITNPWRYIKNLVKKIKDANAPGLDTTEDAEALSLFFLLIPLLFEATENELDIEYLFGWDVLPRKWSDENRSALRASSHGTLLMEKLRAEHDLPDDDDVAAWDIIEAAAAASAPSEQEAAIQAAYRRAAKRWERGEWHDLISEAAFTFSVEIPKGEDSNIDKRLGATIFFISPEDEAEALQEIAPGIVRAPSGGLFVSLNGEANAKYALNDNWDLSIKASSGNLLDFYASESADLNVLGDMRLELEMERKTDPKSGAAYNLPNDTGTRLAVGGIKITAFLSKQDAGLEIGIKENALVLSAKKADGFLKEIMPSGDTPLEFSLAAGLTRRRGFYFDHDIGLLHSLLGTEEKAPAEAERGLLSRSLPAASDDEPGQALTDADSLDAVFPIHKNLGLLNFESIDWSYGKTAQADMLGARLSVGNAFSTKLGPLYIRVEGLGMKMDFAMPPEGGDLSQARLDFGFLAPKRVGIRVEAALITGGGYLDFDPDKHRYAGVLTLNFLDIELTAIGLIDTRLPNNQQGFSMLLSINVLFNPVYQLAYGFTLNGVGGLLGIHRTMKVQALQERVRSGAINSVMFPRNVIENAPKIISDLREIFPPQKGHFVVAPFLKIGWGTPTIVEVDLGILAETPFKKRLILLGSVGIFLPSKEIAKRLVELHIDIFGDFNFAESYVLIEGRLRDSQVVGIPLSGGFAFVLDWGKQPQFLLSVGGYHPRYKKPARFPAIPRLTALVKKGDSIRLACQYYQAITSNSFQIGFSADLTVQKGRAKAIGHLGFNALLQFDPFRFETDIRISVLVSYRGRTFAGVDLYFELSGPEPWRAVGYAKIKVLFFSLEIQFNYSWGGEQAAQPAFIETAELLEKLHLQLAAANNWSSKLPSGFSAAESMSKIDEAEQAGSIFMHPSGFIELRQSLLPLEKTLEKLGTKYVRKAQYRIVEYRVGQGASTAVSSNDSLSGYFSRGQYEDLTDDEKLATADFEWMTAGIAIKADTAYAFSTEFDWASNDFEDITLKEAGASLRSSSAYNWQKEAQLNLAAQLNGPYPRDGFALLDELAGYDEKRFEIVSKTDLERPEGLQAQTFATYSSARDYIQAFMSGEQAKKWQIREAVIP